MATGCRNAYIRVGAEDFSFGTQEFRLGTVVKMIKHDDDPLGYDGSVLARLRAMAEDAIAGINEDAVEEEAALLRNRLRLEPLRYRNAGDPRQ
jgi:hypothetical protein